MKVVNVTPAYFVEGMRGGGERYVTEYVRAQRLSGVDASLISMPSFGESSVVQEDFAGSARISATDVAKLMRNADIVHVHQMSTPGFDFAVASRVGASSRLVLSDYGGGRLTPGRAAGRLRLRAVDGFAAISKWSVTDLDPAGKIDPTAVIYGGGEHVLREDGGREQDRKVDFAFVGRIMPHKGAHVAVEALPDGASLLVAGEIRDQSYKDHLIELARGKDVEFRHRVEDDELASIYRSATALLLPSVRRYNTTTFKRPELLGLVVLEAMACGTIAVGSAVGGLGEVLTIAGQPAVPDGNVTAWAETMNSVLAGTVKRPVSSTFTWSRVAATTIGMYRSVLSEHN